MKRNLLFKLAVMGVAATPFAAARADLVLSSPAAVTIGGTGLGSVSTILTIQDQGTENGAVCRSGATDVVGATVNTSGVCQNIGGGDNTALNQTVSLSNAGGGAITNAAQFGIVFNASEPAGGAITLNTLTVTFYSATGTFLYQASTPVGATFNFPNTETGTGNSGFLFVLNAAQQAAATAAGAFGAGVVVGAYALATNADAGLETFFLANSGFSATVPEPSTTALMATGLIGLVGFVRRRRRNS